MARIDDPDDLNQGIEIDINTTTYTIGLNVAGNLSTDGVSGSAVYSFLKEEWRTTSLINSDGFPILAIDNDAGKFAIGQDPNGYNNWKWRDDTTRELLRGMGWQEFDNSGNLLREYIGVFSGNGVDSASQPYYYFANDTAATNFVRTGPVDEGVQTFGNAANGNFDKRSQVLTVAVRTQGNTYDQISSTALPQLASGLKPIFAPLTLNESTDLDVTVSDSDIDTLTPYTNMSITYYSTAQVRNVNGNKNFGVIVDGANGTRQQIYQWHQRQLRKTTDIDADADSKVGLLQDPLMQFVGERLDTLAVTNPDGGGTGVAIDNYNTNDTNLIRLIDNTGTYATFPFVATGNLLFSQTLQNDTDGIYRMFFTTNPAGNFGTTNAVLVDDDAGVDISGNIGGNSSIAFTFDYDGNTQGGRTAGTDADITIVAIGLGNAQYVIATGTITRTAGQNFTLTSALERNYNNP